MDKNTEIYLVRHGETYAKTIENSLGIPYVCGSGSEISRKTHLTGKGKQQMFEIGKENFLNTKFDMVIISDLIRSRESAEALLAGSGEQNNGVKIIVNSRVTEINYGEDDGISEEVVKEKKKKFFELHPEKNGDFNFAFPGAESFTQAGERMKKALLEIAKTNPGKIILVVSHSGSIRALFLTGQVIDSHSKIVIGQDLKFGEIMKLTSDGEKLQVLN